MLSIDSKLDVASILVEKLCALLARILEIRG